MRVTATVVITGTMAVIVLLVPEVAEMTQETERDVEERVSEAATMIAAEEPEVTPEVEMCLLLLLLEEPLKKGTRE